MKQNINELKKRSKIKSERMEHYYKIPIFAVKSKLDRAMSDEQLEIQLRAFDRKKEVTREEAVSFLAGIGVMNKDGSLKKEYSFLEPQNQ